MTVGAQSSLERYLSAYSMARSQYGPRAQATLYLGEQALAACMALDGDASELECLRSEVVDGAILTTANPVAQNVLNHRYDRRQGHDVCVYNESEFAARYSQFCSDESGPDSVVKIRGPDDLLKVADHGGTHPFVLTQSARCRLWSVSATPAEVMQGRQTDDPVPSAHPVLAWPELAVIAAGELTPAINAGRLKGAVLNNRSGHFRPCVEHLEAATTVLSELLAVPVLPIIYFGAEAQWKFGES